jgi:hypothetical protein
VAYLVVSLRVPRRAVQLKKVSVFVEFPRTQTGLRRLAADPDRLLL